MKKALPPFSLKSASGSAGARLSKKTHLALLCSFSLLLLLMQHTAGAQTILHTRSSGTSYRQHAQAVPSFTYNVIGSVNNTFGYDIYANGRLLIHQPSIPVLPGNAGFKRKAAAQRVAQLVINKMRKGEMPPTITLDEMKSLNAI